MAHHIPRSREITSSPLLRTLNTQVLYLGRLNTIVAEILPAIKTQCQVASYVNGVLTLQTHNHALLGQLRYLHAQYLQQLRQHKVFTNLIKIQFLLAEDLQPARAQNEPAKPLSEQTKKLLLETAQSMADAELSEALRHLAR
ncbi:MAG: DUF721 domain-containing protein [Moraxellaceae bacterium]|nr:DUF721 domain-containing protein [Moraxellaceae bacterium]